MNKDKKTSMLDLIIAETKTLEKLVTDYLCGMLGLDVRKSKSLGYNSNHINLDEKLAILKELQTIDVELQREITIVQEMRNKLAREWRVVDFMFYQDKVSEELREKLEILLEKQSADGAGLAPSFLNALRRINAALNPLSWKALATIICQEINSAQDSVLIKFRAELLRRATTDHDPVALTYYRKLQAMLDEISGSGRDAQVRGND